MRSKIALIYEGVRAEKRLFDNIEKNFFANDCELVVIRMPADGNIYMLWERLQEDDFETDIISVIKEMCKSVKIDDSNNLRSSEFSEVYLFFDYDLHSKKNNLKEIHRGKDIVKEMLETFDNETENGKLYISYPMVESIKDISLERKAYDNLCISLLQSGDYKKVVNGQSDFLNYDRITFNMWLCACKASVKRASFLVNDTEECDYDTFIKKVTQREIYFVQRDKFVIGNETIAIINALPLFLVEYYKESFWNQIMEI